MGQLRIRRHSRHPRPLVILLNHLVIIRNQRSLLPNQHLAVVQTVAEARRLRQFILVWREIVQALELARRFVEDLVIVVAVLLLEAGDHALFVWD